MNKLKEIRKQKKMTLKEVADRANTSMQQIQRLERGDRRLTTDWLQRLAVALDCKAADLVPDLANNDLTDAEQEILNEIRQLDDESVLALRNMAQALKKK